MSDTTEKRSVFVPFLVIKGEMDVPIIRFNVMCELTSNKGRTIEASNKDLGRNRKYLSSIERSTKAINTIKGLCLYRQDQKKDIIMPKQCPISVQCRGN